MYTMNFLDTITKSDAVFYVLLIALICLSLTMFYLIYSQNKEASRQVKIRNSSDLDNQELMPFQEVSKGSIIEEVESLEKVALVPMTTMEIPDTLEYTQSLNLMSEDTNNNEKEELESISKELENLPKERKVNMTDYEAEQEEQAIISYDELLSRTEAYNLGLTDSIDLEEIKEAPVFENVIEESVNDFNSEELINNNEQELNYEYEEKFLNKLKMMQKDLD